MLYYSRVPNCLPRVNPSHTDDASAVSADVLRGVIVDQIRQSLISVLYLHTATGHDDQLPFSWLKMPSLNIGTDGSEVAEILAMAVTDLNLGDRQETNVVGQARISLPTLGASQLADPVPGSPQTRRCHRRCSFGLDPQFGDAKLMARPLPLVPIDRVAELILQDRNKKLVSGDACLEGFVFPGRQVGKQIRHARLLNQCWSQWKDGDRRIVARQPIWLTLREKLRGCRSVCRGAI